MRAIIAERLRLAPRCRATAVLVLAAGGSSRLGRPKQLIRCAGESLLRRAARLALGVGGCWVAVVVGARATRMQAELAGLRVTVIRNRRWRAGLASSLGAGLARVPRRAAYLLVLVVDQWRLEGADLARLIARARPARPVAARYAGRLGVPVVFPRSWFARLERLRGDAGAASLVRAGGVEGVGLERAAWDVDERADLPAVRRAALRSRRGP